MLRNLYVIAAIAAAGLAGGCTFAAVEAMEQIDHAVSKLAQSDCELIRIAHGLAPCLTDEEAAAPEVFCYRRLGGVDCYAARDPFDRPIVNPRPAQQANASAF